MKSKPNILFVFTDQQSANAMSCAGAEELHTPHMDELAAKGVRFSRAYCSNPICTPSRASLMTGASCRSHRVFQNNKGLDESFASNSMGEVFSRAGYKCVYGGKWHLPSGGLPEEGFLGFDFISPFSDKPLAEACGEFFKGQHDKPFLMVASFNNPHEICEWARNQNMNFRDIPKVPLGECPPLPANFNVPAFEPQVIREYYQGYANLGTHAFTPEDWRHYRHAYSRLNEYVDGEVGKILAALKDAGLERDTLVVFSSDHGDMQGAHGLNQKSVLYEESVSVPFIMSLPGEIGEGGVSDALVSNGLDLLPTLCEFADIPVPETVDGKGLRDSLKDVGSGAKVHDAVFSETYLSEPGWGAVWGVMVRSERYKYMLYSKGKHREQLIDLEKDPGEMVNLAEHATSKSILDEHRKMVQAYLEGDVRVEGIPRD